MCVYVSELGVNGKQNTPQWNTRMDSIVGKVPRDLALYVVVCVCVCVCVYVYVCVQSFCVAKKTNKVEQIHVRTIHHTNTNTYTHTHALAITHITYQNTRTHTHTYTAYTRAIHAHPSHTHTYTHTGGTVMFRQERNTRGG